MKIYTKTGDDGTTGLLGNVRVRKDALRLDATGSVDELNAALGMMLAQLPNSCEAARAEMDAMQSDLFVIGTVLATPPADPKRRAEVPAGRITALESFIDRMEESLTPLESFILPQGVSACAAAHFARAVARRAERRVVALAAQERVDDDIVRYLNRLSDCLFVLARWINAQEGGTERRWRFDPGEGARVEAAGTAARDRMDLTLKKLEQQKENRKTLFEKASSDLAKKKEQAERLFQKKVDETHKQGGPVEKPVRDFDLD